MQEHLSTSEEHEKEQKVETPLLVKLFETRAKSVIVRSVDGWNTSLVDRSYPLVEGEISLLERKLIFKNFLISKPDKLHQFDFSRLKITPEEQLYLDTCVSDYYTDFLSGFPEKILQSNVGLFLDFLVKHNYHEKAREVYKKALALTNGLVKPEMEKFELIFQEKKYGDTQEIVSTIEKRSLSRYSFLLYQEACSKDPELRLRIQHGLENNDGTQSENLRALFLLELFKLGDTETFSDLASKDQYVTQLLLTSLSKLGELQLLADPVVFSFVKNSNGVELLNEYYSEQGSGSFLSLHIPFFQERLTQIDEIYLYDFSTITGLVSKNSGLAYNNSASAENYLSELPRYFRSTEDFFSAGILLKDYFLADLSLLKALPEMESWNHINAAQFIKAQLGVLLESDEQDQNRVLAFYKEFYGSSFESEFLALFSNGKINFSKILTNNFIRKYTEQLVSKNNDILLLAHDTFFDAFTRIQPVESVNDLFSEDLSDILSDVADNHVNFVYANMSLLLNEPNKFSEKYSVFSQLEKQFIVFNEGASLSLSTFRCRWYF